MTPLDFLNDDRTPNWEKRTIGPKERYSPKNRQYVSKEVTNAEIGKVTYMPKFAKTIIGNFGELGKYSSF